MLLAPSPLAARGDAPSAFQCLVPFPTHTGRWVPSELHGGGALWTQVRPNAEHLFQQVCGGMCYPSAQPLLVAPEWAIELNRADRSYSIQRMLSRRPGELVPAFRFPSVLADNLGTTTDVFATPPAVRGSGIASSPVSHPNPRLDVYYTKSLARDPALRQLLADDLNALANADPDRPVPQYWNIIDPNLNVSRQRLWFLDPRAQVAGLPRDLLTSRRDTPFQHQWVATDVLVTEEDADFSNSTAEPPQQQQDQQQQQDNHDHHSVPVYRHNRAAAATATATATPPQQQARRRVLRAHLASRVHLLPPGKNAVLYSTIEKVLTAALPLLARLRRPALMLPGPLQVVVKSQRMLLEEGPLSDYSGAWHIDGKHERIAAVVLYYFEKTNLVGGDLEFAEKTFSEPDQGVFWVSGDCTPHSGTDSWAKRVLSQLGRARVPVERGTLAVFSNYQVVHRVLRMELAAARRQRQQQRRGGRAGGDGGGGGGGGGAARVRAQSKKTVQGQQKGSGGRAASSGSRDFLAFFVVDQRHPLQSTANRPGEYEAPLETKRTAADSDDDSDDGDGDGGGYGGGGCSTDTPHADAPCEGGGGGGRAAEAAAGSGGRSGRKPARADLAARRALRDELLADQLKPAGAFGLDSRAVYSTGNGSAAYLGFVNAQHGPMSEPDLRYTPSRWGPPDADFAAEQSTHRRGILRIQRGLNAAPPVLGRGLSWAIHDEQAAICNPASRWHELRLTDPDTGSVSWHYTTMYGRPHREYTARKESERPWADGVAVFDTAVGDGSGADGE